VGYRAKLDRSPQPTPKTVISTKAQRSGETPILALSIAAPIWEESQYGNPSAKGAIHTSEGRSPSYEHPEPRGL